MTIVSGVEYCSGEPRIADTRITVGHVVVHLDLLGSIDRYKEQFPLGARLQEREIKEALEYCRIQRCDEDAKNYCSGCTKNNLFFIDSDKLEGNSPTQGLQNKIVILGEGKKKGLWKVAETLYIEHFGV